MRNKKSFWSILEIPDFSLSYRTLFLEHREVTDDQWVVHESVIDRLGPLPSLILNFTVILFIYLIV